MWPTLKRSALWQLPPGARALVTAVVWLFATLFVAACFDARLVGRDVAIAAAFTTASVVSAELSMRLAWPRTRRDRLSRDLLSVWILPVAILLPPAYVACVVIVIRAYVQLRIASVQAVKLIYSTAALGLSYAATSVLVRVISGHGLSDRLRASDFHAGWTTAAAICVAVLAWWATHHALICGVVALTAGPDAVRSFFRDREGIVVDAVAACIGVLAALLWASSRATAFLLVPPVLLLQHQLFSGLREAVRRDLLTDVANPQFWRETAAREITRASASGENLALLMVDVDHFKAVNDRHGHLAGDEVLAAVARTVAKALRPGDLVGRLGGEEFGAILTGLNLLDAEGAAERLRTQVGELRVRSDRGEWIGVTVSVGVAELSVIGGDLHQLLNAADVALYAAKAAGRNCVRVAGPLSGQVIDLTVGTARSIDLVGRPSFGSASSPAAHTNS